MNHFRSLMISMIFCGFTLSFCSNVLAVGPCESLLKENGVLVGENTVRPFRDSDFRRYFWSRDYLPQKKLGDRFVTHSIQKNFSIKHTGKRSTQIEGMTISECEGVVEFEGRTANKITNKSSSTLVELGEAHNATRTIKTEMTYDLYEEKQAGHKTAGKSHTRNFVNTTILGNGQSSTETADLSKVKNEWFIGQDTPTPVDGLIYVVNGQKAKWEYIGDFTVPSHPGRGPTTYSHCYRNVILGREDFEETSIYAPGLGLVYTRTKFYYKHELFSDLEMFRDRN